MDSAVLSKMLLELVGGLGISLLGMKHMSDGMQAVAGQSLRRLIGTITNNRVFATAVGVIVTCTVQSSSIITVMVVGFVNSGVMELAQAVGVIMGANIGTTITAFLSSLGTTTNARRAAYFHVVFNLFGVFWITPVLRWYITLIQCLVGGDVSHPENVDGNTTYPHTVPAIAATHSVFKLAD